jgi:hypothetical protein
VPIEHATKCLNLRSKAGGNVERDEKAINESRVLILRVEAEHFRTRRVDPPNPAPPLPLRVP